MSKITGKSLEKEAFEKSKNPSFIKKFVLNFFGESDEREEEVATLLKQAANKYFTEKKTDDAIRCLKKSTEIYSKLKDCKIDVKENKKLLIQYLKSQDPVNFKELVSSYTDLAEIYSLDGYMDQFNEQHMEISKIYEKNGNLELSLKQMSYCANNKNYDKVLERKGDILIKMKKYSEASKSYMESAEKQIEKNSSIGQIYSRQLFFTSILCQMTTKNLKEINDQLNKIDKIDKTFIGSVEGKITSAVVDSFNNGDVKNFEKACSLYENYKKLTSDQVELLLIAKEIFDDNKNLENNDFEEMNDDNDIC